MTSPGWFNAALSPEGGVMQQLHQLVDCDGLLNVTLPDRDLWGARGASSLGAFVPSDSLQSAVVVVFVVHCFRGVALSLPAVAHC